MIEQLIEKTFHARNASHIEHWKTKSGFHHQVLGEYYENVISILDKYVEAYIGTFGQFGDIEGQDDVPKMIHDDIVWLNENRSRIAKNIPALENILDELTGLQMSTLFKLENMR
jgi:hypothetical protein